MKRVIGAGLAVLVSATLFAQSAPAPSFEVASVKVYDGPLNRIGDFSSSGTRATWRVFNVMGLLMDAYGLNNYQISFAASARSLENTYYDIFAKAEGDQPRTRAEFRQMLQRLLAERFQLKVHRESRETPVYALVVGKGGPKFKESPADAEARFLGTVNGRNQGVTASKLTMGSLVDDLRIFVNRPVVDRTGLAGAYDIKFEATPGFRMENNPQLADISIFTALEEQLGLKLESQKAPIEVLVVDRVEEPTAN